jgi:hypothetical protein
MPPQPRRPIDGNTWRRLLGPAFRIVDTLRLRYGDLNFRVGGAAVLMVRFDHRLSNGIDLFAYDARTLAYLSPRLNELAKRESLGYEERANAVKLMLPGGDLTIVVAAPVIPGARCQTVDLGDTDVVLEANSEILAKKLLYRANGFKARDVLDISAALAMDRPSAIAALNATAGTRPALLRRLAAMTAVPESELVRDIAITHAGRRHAADMVPRLLLAIAETDNSGMGQQPTRRATRREPDNRMDR